MFMDLTFLLMVIIMIYDKWYEISIVGELAIHPMRFGIL